MIIIAIILSLLIKLTISDEIIPVDCVVRTGSSVKGAGVSSSISCLAGETLVSCGLDGAQDIGGTWVDSSDTNTCIAMANHASYAVSPKARCCTFPEGVVLFTSIAESSSGQTGTATCASGSLTGCQTLYTSGETNKLQGMGAGENSPSNQVTEWLDTGNQCNGYSYSGGYIKTGGVCLELKSGYELECTTKSTKTNHDNFGTCPDGDTFMSSCMTYTNTMTLDKYYITSDDKCYVQQDNNVDQWANAICCKLVYLGCLNKVEKVPQLTDMYGGTGGDVYTATGKGRITGISEWGYRDFEGTDRLSIKRYSAKSIDADANEESIYANWGVQAIQHTCSSFTLADDESIFAYTIWSDAFVYGVEFRTNRGNTYKCVNPDKERAELASSGITGCVNCQLSGFKIRAGWIIDSIQFEFTERYCDDMCYANPEPPCPADESQQIGDADPDLTCGATNHPCVTIAYDSANDIKCDSANPCPESIYFLRNNIFCNGQSSCLGKHIFSYNDADCRDKKSYICCNGELSCSGGNTFLHSPDDDIYCGGRRSCYQSHVANTDDDIHCQGEESCAYATVIACDDNVFCGGVSSCAHATITTYDDDVECCNTLACSYAKMNVMENVRCTASQSCLQSTITFQAQNGGQDQTLDCSGPADACDQLIASCTVNMADAQNIRACTLLLPSSKSYQFMLYADRATVEDDPTQIYYYQYFTLRFQLKVTSRPSSALTVLSLTSHPASITSGDNTCFYPQIKLNYNGILIEYGCPGSIQSKSVTLSSFSTEYSIYIHISRASQVTYTIGTTSGSFAVSGGYDINAIGDVAILANSNYFNVGQVIVNSQPTAISDAPPFIPDNNDIIYTNNKYLTAFLLIFIIFLFISLLSITIYNWKNMNQKKQKKIYQQVAVTDSETDITVLSDATN